MSNRARPAPCSRTMARTTDQQEDDDETQEEELGPEVMSMMTAQEVVAFVKGKQARCRWKTNGQGALCWGTRGSPAGRQRDWPSARGSSGSYEMCQLWEARTQGSRLPGARARGIGKAMFQLR